MTVYINTAMVTGDFNLQALDNVNEITIRRDLEGTYNVFICTPERMYIFEYMHIYLYAYVYLYISVCIYLNIRKNNFFQE